MKSWHVLTILGLAVCVACPVWAQGTLEDTIIKGTGEGPGIAVPPFATAPGMETLGQQLAAVLSYDLNFTGLCRVLTPPEYPPSFTGFTQDATQINFDAWRASRAEFIVHGYLWQEGDEYIADCRLLEVLGGNQVDGKRLRGGRQWLRLIAHHFSEEIVLYLTGVPGIASSQICFSAGDTGQKELYISDYDGANSRQVTQHNSISILPKFSPDGRKIAYLSYKERFPFLYVLDLDTGQSTPLSTQVGLNVAPAWSPDGSKLAIALSKDANAEIYLVNPDGSGKKRITDDRAMDTSPCFSPDGSQIAFVSERQGAAQIFVMGADGSNARRVSFQGGRSYDPAWSPNGEYITYVAEKPGDGMEIYVMNADGSNPQRLTDSSGSNECPSWSPDSRHVLFASSRTGRWELFTVNLETKKTSPVPMLNMRCQGPDWGPRRK